MFYSKCEWSEHSVTSVHLKRQKPREWQQSDTLFVFLLWLWSVIVKLTVPGSLFSWNLSIYAHTRSPLAHTPSNTINHSPQTFWAGRKDGVWGWCGWVWSTADKKIDWDFRILEALCPALCHRFFIRLLPIVTLVYGFGLSSWNVTHAALMADGSDYFDMVLHP